MKPLALGTPFILFLCLVQLIPTYSLQLVYNKCNTSSNYTSGSPYERNLNLTLSSLVANSSLTGFYNTSVGQNLDAVYGLIQCRGSVGMEDCQVCAETSAVTIRQLCPNQKQASIGYDVCSLDYSDLRFFSTANNTDTPYALYNTGSAPNQLLFARQLENLLERLSVQAASNASRLAIGSVPYLGSTNISAMTQCTRDLAQSSCSSCLQYIIDYIPNCCDGKAGGQIFSVSCYLRYEMYEFVLLPSPPADEVPSSPPSPLFDPVLTTDGKIIARTIVIIVIPIGVLLLVLSLVGSCIYWRKVKGKGVVGDDKNTETLLFGLSTLVVATRNFSDANKLGEGGFGPVYQGKLADGREVAVKRLASRSGQGLAELKTEVMLVTSLLHRNLVRLLGFCLEEEEKLLVYELLPNGSLDRILFDEGRQWELDWERRYNIVVGIARGLVYLHEDSQRRIIHRDLKASNILLDKDMNPKISDFGLARLFPGTGSHIQGMTNKIAGTYGYMAPEYAKRGHFSAKSDIFSFGILVLEIVTGRKNSRCIDSVNLQSQSWQSWVNGTALELVDPNLGEKFSRIQVLKCIYIGLLCVQEAVVDRPVMSKVVLMLSSSTTTSPTPSQPAFYISSESFRSDCASLDSGTTSQRRLDSVNDVTISELDPR